MDNKIFEKFYNKSPEERLNIVKQYANLNDEETNLIKKQGPLDIKIADRLIENVIGTYPLPLGIATNFLINKTEYIIPMAIEEPSVVAAASYAAKLTRSSGGFTAWADDPIMIGLIQLVNIPNIDIAMKEIEQQKDELIKFIKDLDPSGIEKYGGGVTDIQPRKIETKRGQMLIVNILINVNDAMGGNIIDTTTEALAPKLEEITKGDARLRIVSNLGIYKKGYAKATWTKEELEKSVNGAYSGEEVVERILDAYEFAEADPFRCVTHNKGIMNGVDAVAVATGNDWRAVEAGVHGYASTKNEKYSSLTKYFKDSDGNLVGEIELPIVVATFGSATTTHPLAPISRKIMKVDKAKDLSSIIATVGLAQNFAALRALATEGIQKGHMKLHARSYAFMVGAKEYEVDKVVQKMLSEKKVKLDYAKQFLDEIRNE
ncbi:MAG: hydroxymethylglutaryl-CoA reductase, degradative [Candidatus ainarchaeum sp.]|nr:hydroxymethylglutaryl-CoA reductase, degradative [Candidatus ainarchaeum sp.]